MFWLHFLLFLFIFHPTAQFSLLTLYNFSLDFLIVPSVTWVVHLFVTFVFMACAHYSRSKKNPTIGNDVIPFSNFWRPSRSLHPHCWYQVTVSLCIGLLAELWTTHQSLLVQGNGGGGIPFCFAYSTTSSLYLDLSATIKHYANSTSHKFGRLLPLLQTQAIPLPSHLLPWCLNPFQSLHTQISFMNREHALFGRFHRILFD